MNDLKFALRQLLKNPGFTVLPSRCRYGGQAVAVLKLAFRSGARLTRKQPVEFLMTPSPKPNP